MSAVLGTLETKDCGLELRKRWRIGRVVEGVIGIWKRAEVGDKERRWSVCRNVRRRSEARWATS